MKRYDSWTVKSALSAAAGYLEFCNASLSFKDVVTILQGYLRASDTARKTCERTRRRTPPKINPFADPLASIDAGLDDYPVFDAVPDDETKKRIDDFIQATEEDAPPIGDETSGDPINETDGKGQS